MAKTASERQREYRERKKLKEGSSYLKKECARVKRYYVKTKNLPKRDKDKRRTKVRNYARKYRLLARQAGASATDEIASNQDDLTLENHVSSTTDFAVQSTSVSSSVSSSPADARLVVRFPIVGSSSSQRSRKRISRCVSRAHKTIMKLKNENNDLQKRFKRISKRYERLVRKVSVTDRQSLEGSTNDSASDVNTCTPRRKTNEEMRQLNIATPRSKQVVRRRLLTANCLEAEIKSAKTQNKNSHGIANLISGKIVKKYRCVMSMSKSTGLNRRSLYAAQSKNVYVRKRKVRQAFLQLKQQLTEFFQRDDNSRQLPGKSDTINVRENGCKTRVQKRVLNDYLGNLHLKYTAENPEQKICLATFCKGRPAHVLPVSFTSRNTCLCSKHQMIALKLKTLKSLKVISTTSPDNFLKVYSEEELQDLLTKIDVDTVSYKVWKKVTLENGKLKTKLLDEELPKNEFIRIFTSQVAEFRQHVYRVQMQYRQLKELKQKLPENHAVVQMDFSENYLCQCCDEIQSAYWNSTMVTLHPTVVYFNQKGSLQHKSFIFVSDTMTHSFSTVYSFIQALLPEVAELVPNLEHVHYWTDSPSSQYRNKYAFHTVCNHNEEFGVRASWSYFETGHGKGPCDGLGGTAKRLADAAVKQEKVTIQSAHDFFFWATGNEGSSIRYIFIPKETCDDNQSKFASQKIKAVKGTMTLHAVYSVDGTLMTKETSCFCDGCFDVNGFKQSPACSWKSAGILTGAPVLSTDEVDETSTSGRQALKQQLVTELADDNAEVDPKAQAKSLNINDFVAAVYQFDNQVYYGKVLDIDETDVKICFMLSVGKATPKYRWAPNSEAETIWVESDFVLGKVEAPLPTGKSQRLFTFREDDMEYIGDMYRLFLESQKC